MKALLLASALLCTTASWLAAATQSTTHRFPADSNTTLEVSGVNGRVSLEAWDGPDVSIIIEKHADNEEDLERCEAEVVANGDRIRATAKVHKGWFWSSRNARVDFFIKVPKSFKTSEVETVNGSIEATSVPGALDLQTVNGGIKVKGAIGDADLSTVNGSIRLDVASLPPKAKLDLSTTNGSCTVSLPSSANVRLDASKVNGSLKCELPLAEVSKKRNHLSGRLGDGSASLSISTVNGSVKIVGQ